MTATTAHDPADAATLATAEAGDAADFFSPAAVRDICRRAAYDMGIRDREAHPEMLPAIAGEAARRMQAEAAGQAAAAGSVPGHVAGMDVLAALPKTGWVMDYRGREFHQPAAGASFSLSQDDETVTIHFCRPGATVEIFNLDRPSTTAGRVARIITAALDEAGQ